MNSPWKKVLRSIVPQAWRRVARRLVSGPVYQGDYANWADAAAVSCGYADTSIFRKTLTAARAVRDGRAAWERDTVLFTDPTPNEPLLAALRHAAAANGGRLNLIDFGGALGSTWAQHRRWLSDLTDVKWNVVEQPHLVEAGRREFTIGPLRFFASLAECCATEQPTTVLLSSVLPYLTNPHAVLAQIEQGPFLHVIIDRTGFISRGRDQLTVQHVPPSIYRASYPCWFFDRATLLKPFATDWRIVNEWQTNDDVDFDAEYRGLMLERIQT